MLAKNSKSFSLINCIAVGVDRMQRNFESKYGEFRPADHLESFECVQLCAQGTGAHFPIQGDGQAGEFLETEFSQSFQPAKRYRLVAASS